MCYDIVIFVLQLVYFVVVRRMDVGHLCAEIPFSVPDCIDFVFKQVEISIASDIRIIGCTYNKSMFDYSVFQSFNIGMSVRVRDDINMSFS